MRDFLEFVSIVFGPLLCAACIILALCAVISCVQSEQYAAASAKTTAMAISFDHDGHRWVTTLDSDGIAHHPDCPCQKKAEAE